jgi:hypothetical protein
MLSFLRRVPLRNRIRDPRDERPIRRPGLFAAALASDVNNIEQLTRALAAKR